MKIGIIGAGFVGSATAFSLIMTGTAHKIVLIDANQAKAEAERIMAESRAHDLQSRRNQGDDTPEDQFLREAMQKATVSSIYETWKKYDLKGVYPEVEGINVKARPAVYRDE